VTSTYDPRHPHGLGEHVRTLTALAGFTIDEHEPDPAMADYADLIDDWVRAAARHATATYLRSLLDAPIDFYRELAASEPLEEIGMHVDVLADLMARRSALTAERQQALTDLTATCQKLTGSGLIWRTDPVQPTNQPPAHPAPGQLTQALTDLGLRPIQPTHPATSAAYGHQHGDRRVTVAVNPFDDPGVEMNTTDGDTVSWTATFGTDTPLAVITAAVRAALDPAAPPTATGPNGTQSHGSGR
jgi:hypothetical protein